MIRHLNKLVCFVLSVLCLPHTLRAGHIVGNPGDPLRLLMLKAQLDASVILLSITQEEIEAVTTDDETVRQFIISNQKDYAERILRAKFNFEIREQQNDRNEPSACAITNRKPDASVIYFRYKFCDRVKSPQDAIFLLLHEVAHQFNITDEALADRIAIAVQKAWANSSAIRTPRWEPLVPDNAPSYRAYHNFTPLGLDSNIDQVFVWGGCRREPRSPFECGTFLDDGAVWSAKQNSWSTIPRPNLLLEKTELKRAHHTAVWDGREFLIFGGCSGTEGRCDHSYRSTLIYSPSRKQWAYDASDSAPSARIQHQATWTGSRMIVWGGVEKFAVAGRGDPVNSGGMFDPVKKTWAATAIDENTPAPRQFFSAVWGGESWLIWGGCGKVVGLDCDEYFNDGSIFHPATNSWEKMAPSPLEARAYHSAVWTGKDLVVWGGRRDGRIYNDGAIYNLKSNKWTKLPAALSAGRFEHQAVWASDRMYVWGGLNNFDKYATDVVVLQPGTTDWKKPIWSVVATPESPVARSHHSMLWLDKKFVIWGGDSEDSSFLNSGAVFIPKR